MIEKTGSLKNFGVHGGACSHNGAVLVSVVIDFKLLALCRVVLAARARQQMGNKFILLGSIKSITVKPRGVYQIAVVITEIVIETVH